VQVGHLTSVSAPDGTYSLEGVPQGQQAVRVSANGFRYLSLSPAAFQRSDSPVSLTIGGDEQRDWGLMQGFLTLPFPAGTQLAARTLYVDLDPGDGLLTWRGDTDTYNDHWGTDYIFAEGQSVLSAAPGTVSDIILNDRNGGHALFIIHPGPLWTNYAHLKTVSVAAGQQVTRGEELVEAWS
jgi:murein DD-endopeptidase MepM/ murein hydrolase activator NlpD